MERVQDVPHLRPGIHVGWFGLRGPEHTLAPLSVLGASAFFLLENDGDAAREQLGRSGQGVEDLLAALPCPSEVLVTDLWSPGAVAGSIGAITQSLRSHNKALQVHVNVSAGPRTAAIGASLAAMFWNVNLFHPGGQQPSHALTRAADAVVLPSIKAALPSRLEQGILRALQHEGGSANGRLIKRFLRSQVGASMHGSHTMTGPQADHNRLRRAADHLHQMGAVERPNGARYLELELTPSGLGLVEMFAWYQLAARRLQAVGLSGAPA